MTIETCKVSGDGYLVNGEMAVPNVPGNRHYREVQDWIADGNTPEPEHTVAEALELTRSEAVRAVKAEALRRISALVPAINTLAMVDLMVELWPGLDTAALGQDIKDAAAVYNAAKSEISAVNSMDAATLASYDPTAW